MVSGGSSVTFLLTTSAGSNRLLLAHGMSDEVTVTGCTYNGDTVTQITASGNTRNWRLIAPDEGTNLSLTFTYSGYGGIWCGRTIWSGVDQTTPLDAGTANSGTSSAPTSGSISVPTDGAIWGSMWAAYTSSGTVTMSAGTSIYSVRNAGSGYSNGSGYRTTTGALTWSLPSSASWNVRAYKISPPPTPPPPTRKMRLFEGFKIKLINGKLKLLQKI